MRHWGMGVCVAALLAATSATAGEGSWNENFWHDTYVKAEGGWVFGTDSEVDGFGETFDIEYDDGWAAAVGVGHYFAPLWRGELEVAYQEQDVDDGNDILVVGGDISAYTFMANLIRDFDTDTNWRPFIGAGLGAARIEPDVRLVFPSSSDDDLSFAWQAMAGVAYDYSDRLALSVRYRYLDAGDYDLGRGEADYTTHAVFAGLTYRLGRAYEEAAAAVPPAVAPIASECETTEPVVTEIVYFEFDRSDLTDDALAVLDRAADEIACRGSDSVRIEGHTDTSGSSSYNQGLSERRAAVVRAGLVDRGVAADIIETAALGERDTAVDTGDGVRNQANRRSEVIIRFR